MEPISDLSTEGTLSELDLFSVPPTQTAITEHIVTEHRPLNPLGDVNTIEFKISTASDEYINFAETLLFLKLRVSLTKTDNTVLTADAWKSISPVNYFMQSLFREVALKIGDNQVTMAPQTYPYKAYFEALLGYTKAAKKSYLGSALWATNEESVDDSVDTTRNTVFTVAKGSKSFSVSNEINLMGRLHLDMALQPKLLLGGTELTLSFKPNSPEFCLMCSAEKLVPKIEITEACLFVHRSKVAPHIVEGHLAGLQLATVKYPIVRSEVKAITLPSGMSDIIIDNVVNGQLPRRLFIAFVDHSALTGSFKKNPFNLKHFKLNYLATFINGVQYPSKPFTPDYDKEQYVREYMSLFEATNQLNTMDSKVNITYDSYGIGHTIYGFNLAQDSSDGCCGTSSHANLIRRGQLRVECHFAEQLASPVNMLCYLEYDNLLEIDRDKSVRTNYM